MRTGVDISAISSAVYILSSARRVRAWAPKRPIRQTRETRTFLSDDRRGLRLSLLENGTIVVLDRLALLALLLVLLALALLYVTSRTARSRGVVRDAADSDDGSSGGNEDSMLVLRDEILDAFDDALRRRGGGHGGGSANGCARHTQPIARL